MGDSSATDNQMKPQLRIVNTGSQAVPLTELKVRYWYTKNSTQAEQYFCDWAQIGCSNIRAQFVSLSQPVSGADSYIELSFTGGSVPAGGNTGEIQNRIHFTNWMNYNETDDWSYNGTQTTWGPSTRITLYRNGVLVWGTEPGGGSSTPTPTVTPTPTPEPTGTPTPEPSGSITFRVLVCPVGMTEDDLDPDRCRPVTQGFAVRLTGRELEASLTLEDAQALSQQRFRWTGLPYGRYRLRLTEPPRGADTYFIRESDVVQGSPEDGYVITIGSGDPDVQFRIYALRVPVG